MGQCHGCVRYILFIFNFLLWLLGCTLLSVGIWLKMDDSSAHHVQRITDIVDEEYQIKYSATGGDDVTVTLAYVLMFFGIVLIIITFIGCCGAVRENTCLLIVFAICLVCMTLGLIGIGIWAHIQQSEVDTMTFKLFYNCFNSKDELEKTTNDNIRRAVEKYYIDSRSKDFMDKVHRRFRCCGGNRAFRDFYDKDNFGRDRARVPASCLDQDRDRSCSYYYYRFVGDEIEEFLVYRYNVIIGVSFGVATVLGIGVALTILFCLIVKRATSLVVT
ncbi:tetraspanin [Plakobranchus ocellatus]|uniref:Tetraspanin n=1 Tax=Plakobranchus ocellatus TaxID=259542 RepID=A0AAV3YDP0_9GAST|nr:tetraspanin [Plakobranchus ocellatus]